MVLSILKQVHTQWVLTLVTYQVDCICTACPLQTTCKLGPCNWWS